MNAILSRPLHGKTRCCTRSDVVMYFIDPRREHACLRWECRSGAGERGPLLETLGFCCLTERSRPRNPPISLQNAFFRLPTVHSSGAVDTSHPKDPCFPEPSICLAVVSVSVFLGSRMPPGVLCVPCRGALPSPAALGPQRHCSLCPIVIDPGSGGNSWWILQYQPAWHSN